MRAVGILLLLCFCFTAFHLRAQSSVDVVDLQAPDLVVLDKRTFQAVNDLRTEKKIAPLAWDTVLLRAAQDQASYLLRQAKLTHNQSSKEKRTPLQRVKLHGGLSFTRVGENLVSVMLGVQLSKKGRRMSTVTLSAAAKTMAQLWKLSPPHYRNIVEPGFNATAVASAYDPAAQRLVCVQVFGFTTMAMALEQADYSRELLAMPPRKLPYRLKDFRPQKKSNRSIRAFMALRIDRGYLVGSFKTARRAFKGMRSGIAQELIPLSQFDSGALEFNGVRNRRNGLFALNGELTRPAWRSAMLRYSRQNTMRKWWLNLRVIRIKERTKLFVYPLDGTRSNVEFNLFLIRRGRLETYRSYNKIPGKTFTVPFPHLEMTSSFKGMTIPPKTKTLAVFDTLEVKAFFKTAETVLNAGVKERLIAELDSRHAKIVRVEASAFASIEGNQAQNERLARERLENLMTAVQSRLDTVTINPVISTHEQWHLFDEQIKQHHLTALRHLAKPALREYVNANKNDSLISRLLAEQRYTIFKVVTRHDSIVVLPQPDLLAKYHEAKRKFESSQKKTPREAAALENAQLAAYRQLMETKDSTGVIPPIVRSDQYPVFQYHDLMFRYLIHKNVGDRNLYSELHRLGRSRYFPSRLRDQLLYNNLVVIFQNYWEKKHLSHLMNTNELYCKSYYRAEFFIRKYKNLKCWKYQNLNDSTYFVLKASPAFIAHGQKLKLAAFPADSLWRFYYLSAINDLSSYIPFPGEIRTLLPQIKKYFHPDDRLLSIDQRITLAFFYCQYFEYYMARKLLEPVANQLSGNSPGFKLYLSLQRDSFKDEHEFAEFIIRQFPTMGRTAWCSLWPESDYLNFLLLEDLKLKNFYNCNCHALN
jgi:uncharacterized protein YkwD